MSNQPRLLILLIDALAHSYLDWMPYLRELGAGGRAYKVKPAPGFRGVEPALNGAWTLDDEVPFHFQRCDSPDRFPPLLSIGDKFLPSRLNRYWRFGISTLSGHPYPQLVPASLLNRLALATGPNRTPRIIGEWESRGLSVWWFTRDSQWENKKALTQHIYRNLYGPRMLKEAGNALESGRDVVYLEFSTILDSVGHRFGPNSIEMETAALRLDTSLKKWLEPIQAKFPKLSVVILSDHGMSEVAGHIDIETLIGKAGFQNGKEYVGIWNSNFGQIWADGDALGTVSGIVAETEGVSVVSAEGRALWFNNDLAYGDLLIGCDEGFLLHPNHFQGNLEVRGMHGYLSPESETSWALSICSGEGFTPLAADEVDMPDLFQVLSGWNKK